MGMSQHQQHTEIKQKVYILVIRSSIINSASEYMKDHIFEL